MKLRIHDSVTTRRPPLRTGTVIKRSGPSVRVKLIDGQVDTFSRSDLVLVAEEIARCLENGKRKIRSCSLDGGSTLKELAEVFGQSYQRMTQSAVADIAYQLRRADLKLVHDGETIRTPFRVEMADRIESLDVIKDSDDTQSSDNTFHLGEKFWPESLGLPEEELLHFLRSLWEASPVLCVLEKPSEQNWDSPLNSGGGKHAQETLSWVPEFWEGILGWAYSAAQQFIRRDMSAEPPCTERLNSKAIDRYLQGGSAISPEEGGLNARAHTLNLVVATSQLSASESTGLRLKWPGPVFIFRPSPAILRTTLNQTFALLRQVSGGVAQDAAFDAGTSPEQYLAWARASSRRIIASTATLLNSVLKRTSNKAFRGSSEGGIALALKVAVVGTAKNGLVGFEHVQEIQEEHGEKSHQIRTDVLLEGVRYEIESMQQSGPWEAFAHQKFAARMHKSSHLNLVVPAETLLWCGPLLADLASFDSDRGTIMFLSARTDDEEQSTLTMCKLAGRPYESTHLDTSFHPTQVAAKPTLRRITLDDMPGYESIVEIIRRKVIPPLEHPSWASLFGAPCILFFGPPGCGKSRFARAVCGELENFEPRMLTPADLRGAYIGWGQIQVSENFSWLMAARNRALIIDEFDAIARSRREGQMHSDEKATTNELLIQLERANAEGRVVMCTTNYVESIDEAILRSGRIGRFVPVPPPNETAAAAIVEYCFRKRKETLHKLETPSFSEIQSVVTEVFAHQSNEEPRFCNANLDAAVGDCCETAIEPIFAGSTPIRPEDVQVKISAANLKTAMVRADRSISAESMERFSKECSRYARA